MCFRAGTKKRVPYKIHRRRLSGLVGSENKKDLAANILEV